MKKSRDTKTYILSVILPLAILPIVIVSIYTTFSFYNRIFSQNKEFYQGIIEQVTANIDFYYNQYATSFADVAKSPVFKNIVGNPVKHFRPLRELLISKVSAVIYLLELNYQDDSAKTPYRLSRITEGLLHIDIDNLKSEPLFLTSGENPVLPMAMGTCKAINGPFIEKCPVFIYPYTFDSHGHPEVMLIAVETANFLHNLYKQHTRLRLGTLYILDQFGNILDYNHPYQDDYYEYDERRKRYILTSGDDPNDPYEGMSFAEYRMLNTDSSILELPQVQKRIENAKTAHELSCEIITFKGNKYLSIINIAANSQMQVVYFHPLKQLFVPIMKTVYMIIAIAVFVTVVVIVLGILFCRYFTRPVNELMQAIRKIHRGDYDIRLVSNDFFGEFIELSNSFNNMVYTIYNYHNNMERMVDARTKELHQLVEQLMQIHKQNKWELQMAQKIQSSLIPKVFPNSKFLQFSSKYMPMETLGGDLYDVYQISDKVFSVLILDVCGHGVPAALITSMAKISFSNNAKKYNDPEKVMSHVNAELSATLGGSGDYFTAFYGIIDMTRNCLSYTNAGHNTMLLSHADGSIQELPNNSPVIGVIQDLKFNTSEEPLSTKDRLVLFTDGLIEAHSPEGELYDTCRLLNTVRSSRDVETNAFVWKIYDSLEQFRKNAPVTDDVALLVIDITSSN